MATTIAERIAQATRKEKERRVKYIWQNPDVSIAVDSELWGEQIELEFCHNPDRKQYEAIIRRLLWQPKEGWALTMFVVFDRENYPSICFHSETVARFGAKSFTKFQNDAVSMLLDLDKMVNTPLDDRVLNLLSRVSIKDSEYA
jgi:hypothetical protein